MSVRRGSIVAFVMAIAMATALDGTAAETRDRVPTVTRLVKQFFDREQALALAMHEGDAAALGAVLSDDFELRIGARAAQPIPRGDFVAEIARTRPAPAAVRAMAVHDLGTSAIVSFTQGDGTSERFVVDVWRRVDAEWRLAIRYAGPAGAPDFAIPGAGAPADTIPKKY